VITPYVTIFIDSSFDPGRRLGVSGFLCIPNCPDEILANSEIVWKLYSPALVKTRIVENTTNTRLELQTLLWALESLRLDNGNMSYREMGLITVYTDCRAAVNLLPRRKRLESDNYLSKRKGATLVNADIYRKIFTLCDELSPEIVWIRGHALKKDRIGIQKVFSEIDKLVRNQLRSYIDHTFS
jgi:ribonuclease HI